MKMEGKKQKTSKYVVYILVLLIALSLNHFLVFTMKTVFENVAMSISHELGIRAILPISLACLLAGSKP